MSLSDEQIDTIIEAHTETVDALKDERDKLREDAEKLPEVQKKLDAALKATSGDESYEAKLAVFYSLYDRLFAEKQEAEPKIVNAPLRSDSEFLRAVAEKDFTSALAVLDELMDSLKILQPRLYDAVMRKLRE